MLKLVLTGYIMVFFLSIVFGYFVAQYYFTQCCYTGINIDSDDNNTSNQFQYLVKINNDDTASEIHTFIQTVWLKDN